MLRSHEVRLRRSKTVTELVEVPSFGYAEG